MIQVRFKEQHAVVCEGNEINAGKRNTHPRRIDPRRQLDKNETTISTQGQCKLSSLTLATSSSEGKSSLELLRDVLDALTSLEESVRGLDVRLRQLESKVRLRVVVSHSANRRRMLVYLDHLSLT